MKVSVAYREQIEAVSKVLGEALDRICVRINATWNKEHHADGSHKAFRRGIGYATGTGATIGQVTSKATSVALTALTGEITLNNAALAAATSVSFTFTNSEIEAADLVVVVHHSGGTAGAYTVVAQPNAGFATVTVRNITAGSLSEAIVLKFAVFKMVTT